jgi:hypothetical protein
MGKHRTTNIQVNFRRGKPLRNPFLRFSIQF